MTACSRRRHGWRHPGPRGRGGGFGQRLAELLDARVGRRHPGLPPPAPTPSMDPISLVAAAIEADLEVALWLRPWEGTAFVGIGRAWATSPAGADRFREAEAAWRDVMGMFAD